MLQRAGRDGARAGRAAGRGRRRRGRGDRRPRRRRRAAARRAAELRLRGRGGARRAACARASRRWSASSATAACCSTAARSTDAEVDEVAAAVVRRPRMSEPSPEERLWDLLRGALGTRALAIVAELGVADALADGPRPVAELAQEVGADAGHAAPAAARARERRRLRRGRARRLRATPTASELLRRGAGWDDFAHLFGGVWYRAIGELDADGRAVVPAGLRDRLLGVAGSAPRRARGVRPRDGAGQGAAGRAARRARLARRRDGRRRRRRQRIAARRARCAASPGLRGIVFDLPETVRDEEALGDRIEFVEGELLRARSRGRRLRPLDDPPRLGRRAGGRDPAHDPRRGAAGRAPADRRRRRRRRERAGRREVARPADARAASAAASATRRSGASCSTTGGFEPS